ncbi:MAG: Fur family transcriptional regulator [Lacipirellulaceae bacterium]
MAATPTRDAAWAKAEVKGVGLRGTAARVAVLRSLAGSPRPLSHGELVDLLSEMGFDQSTIYRGLNELADAGLLSRLDLGDQVRRFEWKSGGAHHDGMHPHFMCVDCGSLRCLEDFEFRLTPGRGPRRAGVGEITEVMLRGHCPACQPS